MKRPILVVAALALVVGSAGRAEADLILTTSPDVTVVEGTNFDVTFIVLNNGPDLVVNQHIVGRNESFLDLVNLAGLHIDFRFPSATFPDTIAAGATVNLVVPLKALVLTPPSTISTGNLVKAVFFYDDPQATDREVSATGQVSVTVIRAVPEPGSICLLGIGGLGLLAQSRRRTRNATPTSL